MTKELPTISGYGEYSNGNYGLNALMVDLGSIRVYYSYNTIVAFYTIETGLVVHQNDWSTTTGRHLNWIDRGNKSARLPHDKFEVALREALTKHII